MKEMGAKLQIKKTYISIYIFFVCLKSQVITVKDSWSESSVRQDFFVANQNAHLI